ncbi:MAG TPA: class I SAM-dependent methyltransferase [Anaerolineaceae bacterium]|nr:class I SAM-dependent methyltransferase [Anaerolineaceae bacterium]
MDKASVTLTKEQETLLIPLYSKAQPNPVLDDPKARQILAAAAYDFSALRVPEKTAVTLRIRAKKLDEYARQMIGAHPNALILHLGCGLDSRCERVARAQTQWFDLDLPDVIALRRKFYSESETYRMIASSVTDLAWVEQIPAEGRPVLIIAEGLLMYLPEEAVKRLILCLHRAFPGSRLAFDAFSQLTVERIKAHPSLQKTGATIQWGIDDPHAIEGWADGIRLLEEWFFSQSPDIDRLSWYYRLMFRLTRSISAAQRAQRILYFQL